MEKGNGEEDATSGTGTTTATTEGGGGPSEIADQRQESSAEWTNEDGENIRKTVAADGTTTTEILDEDGFTTESHVAKPRPDGKFDWERSDADGNVLSSGEAWSYDKAEGPEGARWIARQPDAGS